MTRLTASRGHLPLHRVPVVALACCFRQRDSLARLSAFTLWMIVAGLSGCGGTEAQTSDEPAQSAAEASTDDGWKPDSKLVQQLDGVRSILADKVEVQPPKSYSFEEQLFGDCLLYTSPSPRDRQKSRMPSSA